MAVIQGPWKRAPEPERRNHPAGRRRRRPFCKMCDRPFQTLANLPDDRICRECRATLPPPDPVLFNLDDTP